MSAATARPGRAARVPGAHPEAMLPRGACVGRFVVVEELGRGGMAVVYRAYDPQLDRLVALKVVGPAPLDGIDRRRDRDRLLREAQALARLTHPNVVAVHDVGTVEGRVWIAMELVVGRSLGEVLATDRPPPGRVLELFAAAGQGLAAAHRAGLVHRDFKPDNVAVGEDGRVRVLDFGLARAAVEDGGDTDRAWSGLSADDLEASRSAVTLRLERSPGGDRANAAEAEPTGEVRAVPRNRLDSAVTEVGKIVGTPGYMPPERLIGVEDARADQFAFCVALFEGLYGARPFAGGTLAELVAAITAGKLPAPP